MNYKELFYRTTKIVLLFVISLYLLKSKIFKKEGTISECNTKLKSNKQKEILRNIERINAYIEEQDFLLSTINHNSKEAESLLKIIETNVSLIEKEAKNNKVYNLINTTEIEKINCKIANYRQIVAKRRLKRAQGFV